MSPRPRTPDSSGSPRRFGVIDIGTNSLKLIVASVKNGRVVDHHVARVPTRLGQGLSRSGRISAAAARRTAVAVKRLADDARVHDASDVIGVGTYALRVARNGRAVAREFAKHAGIRVSIITGAQEAAYVLASVRARIRRLRRQVMVADIGGGSAQLIVARGPRTLLVRSVPLGAVVLTEHYLAHDPIEPVEYARLCEAIDAVVSRLFARLPRVSPADVDMVVSGGAATTAATMTGARPGKTGCTLSVARLEELEARCLAATIEERRAMPGMQPDRADILPAGLAVLLSFARHAHQRSVKIVEGGWREGIILERAEKAARARSKTRPTARAAVGARKGR